VESTSGQLHELAAAEIDCTRTHARRFTVRLDTGFRVEYVGEPTPDDDTGRRRPGLQDAQIVAYFLHM
jgi:hypothetical protein